MKALYSFVRTYHLLISILPMIAFYRATVQPEYKWGMLILSGRGISLDYWWLLLFMIYSWLTFTLESWLKKKWYYSLLISNFFIVAIVAWIGFLKKDVMLFQGDAWWFSFDFSLIILTLSSLTLIAACIWSYLDLKKFQSKKIKFRKNHRVILIIGLLLAPVIFLLFAQGEGGIHSNFDRIAVALVVVQALLLAHVIDNSYQILNHDNS